MNCFVYREDKATGQERVSDTSKVTQPSEGSFSSVVQLRLTL